MNDSDTSEIAKHVQRIIELHGGRKLFFEKAEQRQKEFNSIWNQDAEIIGRVLRAHLAVEHFLTKYLQTKIPGLTSLEDARLTFYQKTSLLNNEEHLATFLKAGLRRLNKIRNRLAHNLSVDISNDDRLMFLSIEVFDAMRKERAQRSEQLLDDPLSVTEQFAEFAAGMLHAASDANANIWRDVLANDD